MAAMIQTEGVMMDTFVLGLTLFILGLFLVSILVPVWVLTARRARQSQYRSSFAAQYGVQLDPSFRMASGPYGNWFRLSYPYWAYAKRDGTKDLRHGTNPLMTPSSVVHVGEFEITVRDFMQAYGLVLWMRTRGVPIEQSELEQREQAAHRADVQAQQTLIGAQAIYHRFANDPGGFERFCGDLLRQQGYQVEVTPYVNDGGLDLRLRKNGMLTIAECKCYNPQTGSVGRPVLQKLYGANAAERANGMLVITTARFTQAAKDYARDNGVDLIDGGGLSQMTGVRAMAAARPNTPPIPDLMRFVPEDARGLYVRSYESYRSVAEQWLQAGPMVRSGPQVAANPSPVWVLRPPIPPVATRAVPLDGRSPRMWTD